MEINEIKKALYREKPIAKKTAQIMGLVDPPIMLHAEYKCKLKDGTTVIFAVPRKEMGEKPFDDEVPAQLLIRWMVRIEEIQKFLKGGN